MDGISAAHTILPPLESNPFTGIYHFARRRSTCLFLFALTVFATEVLTMLVGPGYLTQQIMYTDAHGIVWGVGSESPYTILWAIQLTCFGILSLGFLVLVGYLSMLPKRTDGYGIRTVADTLQLVCSSQCVKDFAQVSMLEENGRNKTVLGWKEKYAFGVTRGEDDVKRCGIDFRRFIEYRT
jgi:hypothetical protein